MIQLASFKRDCRISCKTIECEYGFSSVILGNWICAKNTKRKTDEIVQNFTVFFGGTILKNQEYFEFVCFFAYCHIIQQHQ